MSLLPPIPRPCVVCVIGRGQGTRCTLRQAVLAETGREPHCIICGLEASDQRALVTGEDDQWYCADHIEGSLQSY